jgi:hypothetical protein
MGLQSRTAGSFGPDAELKSGQGPVNFWANSIAAMDALIAADPVVSQRLDEAARRLGATG